MKIVRLSAFLLALLVVGPVAVSAQQAASKIGIINTLAFRDEKAGITKLVNAMKALNTEFTPAQTELKTLSDKLNVLAKEVETMQRQQGANNTALQAKIDEANKIDRDIKFKTEDAKARYARREQAVLSPVSMEIGNALTEYAKQKGYTLIIDLSKDEVGLIVAIGDEKIDITSDFIAYFNARPATAK